MSIPVVGQIPSPAYSLSLYDLNGVRMGVGNEFLKAQKVRFSRIYNQPGVLTFTIPKEFEDDAFQWIGCEVRLVREADEANPIFTGLIEQNTIQRQKQTMLFRCPGLASLLYDQVVTWVWSNLDTGGVAKAVLDQFVNKDRIWITGTFPGTIQESGYGIAPVPTQGMTIRADKQRPKQILDTLASLAGSWAYRVEKVAGVNTLFMEPPPSAPTLDVPVDYLATKWKPDRNLTRIVTGLIAYGGRPTDGSPPLVFAREDPTAVAAYKGRRKWETTSNSQLIEAEDLLRWTEMEMTYRTRQLKKGNLVLPWRRFDAAGGLEELDPQLFVPNMKIRLMGFDSTRDGGEEMRVSSIKFDLSKGTINLQFGIRHDFIQQRFAHEIDALRHSESDSLAPLFQIRETVPALRHLFGTDFPSAFFWGSSHFWGGTPFTPRNNTFSHKLTFEPSGQEFTI